MNTTRSSTCFPLDANNFGKTEEVFITNALTCVLNSLFSLLTFAGNFLILHAIRKSQNLHSPSSILLCCLATSDLLVGAICQPLLVVYKIAQLVSNLRFYCTFRLLQSMSGWIMSGASSLILALVAVDRLLALTLHLRYRTIVTIRRVFITVFILWITVISVVLLRFLIVNWTIIPLVTLLLTFFVTAFCTSKIFHIVRKHQRHINDQSMAIQSLRTNSVNVLKCKKSAVTVLYIYGLFLMFYIPIFVIILVEQFIGYTRAVQIAYDYVTTAVFINSFLNPLVYCWRMREIRQAVKNVLRKE